MPSIDVSKLKDLAKGIVGIPDIRTAQNFSKGCVILIIMGILLIMAPLGAVFGQANIDVRTREFSPGLRGLEAGSIDADRYPGCGYLLNATNSLTKEELKKALLKIRGGSTFAQNDDILDGFVQAADQYHLSNVYIAAHAGLESAWGTSRIAQDKKNLFGYGAIDSDPYNGAYTFSTYKEGIQFVMGRVKTNYLTPGGKYYVTEATIPTSQRTKAEAIKRASGVTVIEPESLEAMNVNYASDVTWAKQIKDLMTTIFNAAGKNPQFINNCH